MAHKTIRHVLTHWAEETSLASCLAARDNRPPVLVPVKMRRTQAMLLPCVCLCMHMLSLRTCANAKREKGLCLWGQCSSEMTDLSYSFPLPLCVLLNIRYVIWRCCFDPFLLRGGNSLREPVALYSFGCRGTHQRRLSRGCIPRTHNSLLSTKRTNLLITFIFFHQTRKKEQGRKVFV